MQKNNSQLLIYQTKDSEIKIETQFEDETVWLTQSQVSKISLNPK